MRRFARSAVYARLRLFFGLAFIGFGLVIIVQGVRAIGFTSATIVPVIFGLSLMGLGAVRIRDYRRLRSLR